MAYAVHYRKKFQNYDSVTYRIDILDESGDPVVTPDKLSVDPGQLRTLAAGKDEYKVIIGSEFAFDFILNRRTNESDYDALFESEYRDHIVKFYNDGTSDLLWQGYLQPENSVKDIHERNVHMSFSATDALKDLADYEFTDGDELITGHITGLQILKYCLTKLDIDSQFQYNFIVKLGTKHTGEGANDCALKDVTHDCRRFYKNENGKTTIDTCEEVIEKVLKPYHCQLMQYGGQYYIRHRYEGDTDYYIYNWALAFQSKPGVTEIVNIDSYKYNRGTEMSLISPTKQFGIRLLNRNMGDPLVADLDDFTGAGPWDLSGFTPDDPDPEDGGTVLHCYITDENSGSRTITLSNDFSLNKVTDGDYIKFRFQIYADIVLAGIGSLPKFQITVTKPGSVTRTTWETFIPGNWYLYESPNDDVFKIIADGDYNIEIDFIESDDAGADYEEDVYFKDVELIKITAIEDDTYTDISFDQYYKCESDKGKTIEEDIDLYFADTTGTNDLAALVYSGSNTDEWDREGQDDNASLQYLFALDYLSDRQDYRKYIMIDVKDPSDNITPINIISFGGNTYSIASYEKSYRTSWCRLHLRQRITAGDITLIFNEIALTSIDGESAVSSSYEISNPATTDHNNLSGLNVGNYQHLTAAELADVQALDSMAFEAAANYYTSAAIDTWRNSVTQTEMGYLHGVTSDVQGQINTKDNYVSWDVKIGAAAADSILSGEELRIIAGSNISFVRSSGLGWYGIEISSSGGGAGDVYKNITDGMNTAQASGTTDTFKLRSTDNKLTILVANDDVTHGDNALFTINEVNINHNNLTNYASNRHFLMTDIDHLDTALSTGLVKVTTGTGAISIITDNSSNWNIAYGWGDHSSAGYMSDLSNDLSPELGGDLTLASGAYIKMPASIDQEQGAGIIITGTVDVNAFGIGCALGLASDGHWESCDADVVADFPCSGLALETGTGAGKKILLYGVLSDGSYSFTAGLPVYVSNTDGGLVTAAPGGASDLVQRVGIALDSDTVLFTPSLDVIQIAS